VVRLLRIPGVYPPQGDSYLLAEALEQEELARSARVLDVCTGSGVLAVKAARSGARVTAVDISRRACWTARGNALLSGLPVKVHRGDLLEPVAGQRFGLVLANPPYVPQQRSARWGPRGVAWNAGHDGRAFVDPLCMAVPRVLMPSGVLLMVHSALCGVEQTLRLLQRAGLRTEVRKRVVIPFGPVMRRRASWLEERGYIRRGQRDEELVVIRGRRV
jgi:release factor glutamine methyltransferase